MAIDCPFDPGSFHDRPLRFSGDDLKVIYRALGYLPGDHPAQRAARPPRMPSDEPQPVGSLDPQSMAGNSAEAVWDRSKH